MADLARITELAIAATARLTTSAGDEAEVGRCYVSDADPKDLKEGQRFVQVWAPGYTDEGMVTRNEQAGGFSVEVAIYEKYKGQEGPPNEWMDERVAWVKEKVVDVLGDAKKRLAGTAWPETLTVAAYNEELYLQGVFWSNVLIVFKDTE